MAVVVNSPHNGRPVKVRQQDVGRAVRDDEGHIFYVLARSDAEGYVGSLTRGGGAAPPRPVEGAGKALDQEHAQPDAQEPPDKTLPHDATGKRRSKSPARLVIVILLLTVAVLAYLFSPYGPFGGA